MRAFLVLFVLVAAAFAQTQRPVAGAAGDGVTDDTAALQRAIDGLAPYGVLDGGGLTYVTGTLKLKSRMTFQNFCLKTRTSSIPLTSPVTLDGTVSPISEVRIDNVHVDGNRRGQTNLATEEDGGRDGFRIVGVARNVWIQNSSAVNCGTDGLKIFSADVRPPAGALNFTDIWVVHSIFDNNRRHGISADAVRNLHLINVRMNGNGLAVPASGRKPTEGESAFVVNGMLYGAGLVIEGYNQFTGVDNLNVVGCTATGNARFGIQFWDPARPQASGFVQRSNIRIESSYVDGGVATTHGRQAIEFNVPHMTLGSGYVYRNVTLANNRIVGTIIVNSVAGFRMIGGTVESPYPGFYAISQASQDIVIQSVSSEGKIFARL